MFLTFHCLNKLFMWSQKFCKFLAFSLDFQKFFLITRTILLHKSKVIAKTLWKYLHISTSKRNYLQKYGMFFMHHYSEKKYEWNFDKSEVIIIIQKIFIKISNPLRKRNACELGREYQIIHPNCCSFWITIF